MSAGPSRDVAVLEPLTITDIQHHCPPKTFSRTALRSRQKTLAEAVTLSSDVWDRLVEAADRKKRRRKEVAADNSRDDRHGLPHHDDSRYLEVASESDIQRSVREYIQRTSNAAMAESVCASCARRLWTRDCALVSLPDIPNRQWLVPEKEHPAHVLTDGMLLELAGVVTEGGTRKAWICRECHRHLKADSLPRYSLCNNLWIGDIPPELRNLTITEEMLMGLRYPRCFVYKMVPRKGGGDRSKMQRGLKGNVTCYDLDPQQIVGMVEGTKFPRRTALLASLFTVTLCGVGQVPKKWLKGTFAVDRQRLHTALVWRCQNNPYFGHIEICGELLGLLPKRGVPDEILASIRFDKNSRRAQEEEESYVRADDTDESDPEDVDPSKLADAFDDSDSDDEDDDTGPDVVPVQSLGVCDNNMSKLSPRDLLMAALAKGEGPGKEGGYAVRHSWKPVSDFRWPQGQSSQTSSNPNPMSVTFPSLFPYGIGGIEDDRPISLTMEEHVRWLLQYHDRRFCHHYSFMFVVFGILQKRQVMSSARVQMDRPKFFQHAKLLESINAEDIAQYEADEKAGKKSTNPKIKQLTRLLTATSMKVMGSNASRASYRANIWGTTLIHGPPSLWVTLNFDDRNCPITQVIMGEDIDLDNFSRLAGPSEVHRALNVARDPVAAARAFHFWINIVLVALFGISRTDTRVVSRRGVSGDIGAYFGVIEAQGRGTLHLHSLMWLQNTPTSRRIHELLQDPVFREKAAKFIRMNMTAYAPGLETKESVSKLPKEKHIGYNRPPHPDRADFWPAMSDYEKRAARSAQVHVCRPRLCLKYRKGKEICKRRAPFPVADDAWIDSTGQWGMKRSFEYLNGWHPSLMPVLRSNHDVKFITNGSDTKNLTYYFAGYETKGSDTSYNSSALLAPSLHRHMTRKEFAGDVLNRGRLMMISCQNTLNRQQELSGPQVASYLLGMGDHVKSHNYAPIYSSALTGAILRAYPELKTSDFSTLNGLGCVTLRGEGSDGEGDPRERVSLGVGKDGKLRVKPNQVDDYQWRGAALEDFCFFFFAVETYSTVRASRRRKDDNPATEDGSASNTNRSAESPTVLRSRKGKRKAVEPPAADNKCASDATSDGDTYWGSRRGRPANARVPYMKQHPEHSTKERVVRTEGHNTLPSVMGPYFPRNNDPDTYDYYCATMLALFKPWRKLADLKVPMDTWENAFDTFMAAAPAASKSVISNIQYRYECSDAADRKRQEKAEEEDDEDDQRGRKRKSAGGEDDDAYMSDDSAIGELAACAKTAEDVEELILRQDSSPENMHASTAVLIGQCAGVFLEEGVGDGDRDVSDMRRACGDDFQMMRQWERALTIQKENITGLSPTTITTTDQEDGTGDVQQLQDTRRTANSHPEVEYVPPDIVEGIVEELTPADIDELNTEQRRVFDIGHAHLLATMDDKNPPQLLMYVYGEGGVGKSKVIQTLTKLFETTGSSDMLAKGAYTGIAASLIGGSTLHTLLGLDIKGGTTKDNEKLRLLERKWGRKRYLILDEVSMVSAETFSLIDVTLKKLMSSVDKEMASGPFGGISVFLFGDFHQFPPVCRSVSAALFAIPEQVPEAGEKKELLLKRSLGRRLYEQFNVVVKLKQQMRVNDQEWIDILRRARHGECSSMDLDFLRDLVITNLSTAEDDYNKEPWNDAVLVTPRHAVRIKWNSEMLRKFCNATTRPIFEWNTTDTARGEPVNDDERYAIMDKASKRPGEPPDCRGGLPHKIELAIGAKVMVTFNLHTELDIANGARGVVDDIIFDEDEPVHEPDVKVRLKRTPVCILVRLERSKAVRMAGLDKGVVPVLPCEKPFTVRVAGKRRTIRRKQFPLTLAYAFTDYRSQGQTIPILIVDIGPPPSGSLSPFNAYVALSRSKSSAGIRLLRDFNDSLFTTHPSDLLDLEDNRLDELDAVTEVAWSESGGSVEDLINLLNEAYFA